MKRRVIFPDPDIWTTPKETTMTDDEHRRPPHDLVPPATPTRGEIICWNDMVGTTVTISQPGEIIPDPDGLPAGMTPNQTYTVPLTAPLQVFRDQLEAAGLTPADVPNLTVISRKENRR